MSIAQIKAHIIQQIQDADPKLIKMIDAMIDVYQSEDEDPIIGYNTKGEPQYASIKIKQYIENIADAKNGEYYTIEDLEKEKEWLAYSSR